MHRLAASHLDAVGLDRRGRSRWYAASSELVWVAELDRSGARPWSVGFGVVVRAWLTSPTTSFHSSDGHYVQEYASHPSGVPASAAQYRWDDHASYFTACFDHRHELVDEAERDTACRYLAEDLAALFRTVATTAALVEAVRRGRLARGAVSRALEDAVSRG